jgi:alkylation response protein AidB-like acyl-CoA dehydrogenase
MRFELTDEQQEIGRTARELLEARFPLQRVQELADAGRSDDSVSREIVELGWVGIALPEEVGGAGLGLLELVTLQEQIGYCLAPIPYLADVAAALAIAHSPDAGIRDQWLDPLLAGEVHGCVGLADEDGALVPGGEDAAFCVVVSNNEARVYERDACKFAPVATVDETRRFARVTSSGDGVSVGGDITRVRLMLSLAVAAESVGIAQRMVEAASEYAREREQFGQPIGVHQAVSHRCARMLLVTESARSLVQYAAWAGDTDAADFELAACSAKAFASECGWRVPADAVQVHGGIGFSWEHPAHRFLKRGRMNAELYGDARAARKRVAELVTAENPKLGREG